LARIQDTMVKRYIVYLIVFLLIQQPCFAGIFTDSRGCTDNMQGILTTITTHDSPDFHKDMDPIFWLAMQVKALKKKEYQNNITCYPYGTDKEHILHFLPRIDRDGYLTKMASELINAGADVNKYYKNNYGAIETPLVAAALCENIS
jgi:hypothetical protein